MIKITTSLVGFLSYIINKLTRFREYLIKKSIPNSQTPQEWASGYLKWQQQQKRKYGTKK